MDLQQRPGERSRGAFAFEPGWCMRRPQVFRPAGMADRAAQNRVADQRRGSARQRGYNARWEKARATYLSRHPTCVYCALIRGRVEAATCVDHLYPHHVYEGTFWRTDLWCASCAPCHASWKQGLERRGKPALDDLARRLGRPILT